ncbi:MAG: hypothetical protein ABIT37_20130 [Luteolibacter sp.]
MRPCFCFVADEYVTATGLDRAAYLASRWPGINCSSNENSIGSHLLPDMDRPADIGSESHDLSNFLLRLGEVAAVKASTWQPP